MIRALKTGANFDEILTYAMSKQTGSADGGSVTLSRPDGTQYPGSPFTGGGLPGPRELDYAADLIIVESAL
jgi:hypothetical protein